VSPNAASSEPADPIRVGILGFAHGHVMAYCNVWKERPELGVRVVAAWDHDTERLRVNAERYGLEAYHDVSDLLSSEVDAVVVTSETSMHADLVEQATSAGKAIVVQKPMALTMGEADRIVAAVERHGVPFTMAWQMRVDPQNVRIKEMLDSGELGKVLQVRRRHALATHLWPTFVDLWHNKPEYNRDIWADDAAHPIDFIHWLLGVPETVTAEIETLLDPRVVNDNGIAIYKYPGGPLAEVVCSFTCGAHENTTEVVCEKGTIIQNFGDGPSNEWPHTHGAEGLKWWTTETRTWTNSGIPSPAGHGHRIAALAEPLAQWMHGQRPPIATVQEGRMSLRMTLACYVSAREGRRVRIMDPAVDTV
jgi:predicted dehydrogenase